MPKRLAVISSPDASPLLDMTETRACEVTAFKRAHSIHTVTGRHWIDWGLTQLFTFRCKKVDLTSNPRSAIEQPPSPTSFALVIKINVAINIPMALTQFKL